MEQEASSGSRHTGAVYNRCSCNLRRSYVKHEPVLLADVIAVVLASLPDACLIAQVRSGRIEVMEDGERSGTIWLGPLIAVTRYRLPGIPQNNPGSFPR